MFGRNKEPKYIAVFLKKEGQKYVSIGEKDIKLTDETIPFQDKSFVITAPMNTLLYKGKNYVFYDYGKSKIVTFIENEMGIDAELLDLLIVKKIIQQLVSSIRQALTGKTDKGKILTFLFVFAFGAIVGYVISTVI